MHKVWSKFVLIMMLITMISLSGGIGCAQDYATDNNADPVEALFHKEKVATVRIVMSDQDWAFTQKNGLAEQYVKADLWFDDELIPDVAVRPKGNSSLRTAVAKGSGKMGLKLDLNFFNSVRNFHGIKKLNLNNGFSDPTFIREVLGYELFEQVGLPTPRTAYADVWVNDTHLGLYTIVEQIDKTFLEDHFDYSNGNLYKPEMPAAYLTWTEEDVVNRQGLSGASTSGNGVDSADINLGGGRFTDILRAMEPTDADGDNNQRAEFPDMSRGMPPPGGAPPGMTWDQSGNLLDRMGLKTNEDKPDHTFLFRFLGILNNESDETFPAEIEQVLDVDSTLRFLAVSALIVHLDNYIAMGHNYYLYDNDGKFVVIPWDLNMAFGTFNYGLNRDQLVNYYIDEPTGGTMAERPLVQRLLAHKPYLDAYHGYLQELLDGPFNIDRMDSRIDELAVLIRPYVKADKMKFFSTEQFEQNLSQDIAGGMSMGGRPLGLKNFIAERSKSVREQLDGTRKPSQGDGSGNGGRFGFGPRFDFPEGPRQSPSAPDAGDNQGK